MTQEEMKELAKSAAHSIIIATYSTVSAYMPEAVKLYLETYEYTIQVLKEKYNNQVQQQMGEQSVNQDFFSEQKNKLGKIL